MADSIFALSARANHGGEVSFRDFEGKVLLVANTASRCGFTPQYQGLEQLHRTYGNRGLVVLGFPCDQFAHQEPGDDEEIARFCQVNYGVTFPLMSKVEVNGPGAHPVFRFLKAQAPGFLGQRVKWNFTKFLVQRDGRTVKRFAPYAKPEKLERDIRAALGSGQG
jgi:glutathione peroxidase